MRIFAGAVLGLGLATSMANAEPSALELQKKGEDLAKQRRFSEAIEAFKAADRVEPTATHACLIALAYTRRELWPQAEIWLALCQLRASPTDPLPTWAPAEQDEIDKRLASANVAPVSITVDPVAGAKLTVSSFAPDEQFAPRTIHLPPGLHQVIARAPGYKDGQQTVEVKDHDKSPIHVDIKLDKLDAGGGDVTAAPVKEQPPRPVPSSDSGKKLMVVGGIALGAGVVAYGVMGVGWYQLDKGKGFGGGYETMYDGGRIAAISLWTIGAGLAITGYVLHSRHHDEVPAVGIAPTHGGGMVSVGWSR